MNKKKLLVIALAFCLVTTLFMAIPAFGVSAPPFDLYAAVRDIQTKVNSLLGASANTLSQLSTLQNSITNLEGKLWSGTSSVAYNLTRLGWNVDSLVETLYPGGAFYNYINGWFWNFDQKLDTINQKVSQENSNLQVIYAKSGEMQTPADVTKIVLRVRTNCTCQITLTVCTHFAAYHGNEIDVYTDHSGWQYPIYRETGSDWSEQYYADSMTFAANSTQIQITGRSYVSFQIIAMGPPNTIITQFLSDYPENITSSYP